MGRDHEGDCREQQERTAPPRGAGPETREDPPPRRIGFGAVVLSTLAAAIGVQSRRNKERDFGSGRIAPFIVAGIVFTVLFVLTIVLVVRMVIASA